MEEQEKILKIGIVGAGAVGGVVSTILTSSGYDVEICYRHKSGIEIDNRISIDVVGELGEYSQLVKYVDEPTCFTSQKDIIFVFTRAYNTVAVVDLCKNYLTNDGIVVITSNVILMKEISKVISLDKVAGVFIGWSSIRENYTKMNVTNGGDITIGAFSDSAAIKLEIIKSVLNNIAPTRIEKDMTSFIVSRVIINSAISATGAISGLRLGKVLSNKNGRKIFINLIKEAVLMFSAMNVNIIPYNDQLDYLKFKEKSFSNSLYVNKIVNIIQKNNSYMMSSALYDMEKGVKTETDYLSGKIANFGESMGIKMSFTRAVVDMIKQIEEGKFSIYDTNLNLIVKDIEKGE